MKSSKSYLPDPEKGQQEQPETPEKRSGRIRLNNAGDLALLRLQNAAEGAEKAGVATISPQDSGAWIVRFTPLTEQGKIRGNSRVIQG